MRFNFKHVIQVSLGLAALFVGFRFGNVLVSNFQLGNLFGKTS